MKTLFRVATAAILAFGVASSVSAATIYDIAADFSLASNPNGTWSYGYYSSGSLDQTSFTAFTNTELLSSPTAGLTGGVLAIHRDAVDPNVVKNVGSADSIFSITFNADQVTFGPTGGPAVTRWTAPSDGLFQVEASFATVQTINTSPYAWVWDGTSFVALGVVPASGTGSIMYSQLLSLSGGQFVDFVVGGTSGFVSYKTTEVSATIAAVPEPATLLLLGTGLGAVAARRRLKKRA